MFRLFVAVAIFAVSYASSLRRATGACATELAQVNAHIKQTVQSTGRYPAEANKPNCMDDGGYLPKQCYGGNCRCVASDGTILIQDFPKQGSEGNNCNCARDQHEYRKQNMLGKTFMCTDQGAYEEIQCLGSVCYCANVNGEQIGTTTVNIGQIETLNCDGDDDDDDSDDDGDDAGKPVTLPADVAGIDLAPPADAPAAADVPVEVVNAPA